MVSLFDNDMDFHLVGIRPGEKLHEIMIPAEEIRNTYDLKTHFVIQPNYHWWNTSKFKKMIESRGTPVVNMSEYASNTNDDWLAEAQLKSLIRDVTLV